MFRVGRVHHLRVTVCIPICVEEVFSFQHLVCRAKQMVAGSRRGFIYCSFTQVMKQTLERRESSLRVSPLYACVIGAKLMNVHDPKCYISWPRALRPPPTEINHLKCAQLLLDAGANPNAKDVLGKCPLSSATNGFCSDESLKIAALLATHPKTAPILDKDPHCRQGFCLLQDHCHSEAEQPNCTACIMGWHKKCVETLINIGAPVLTMRSEASMGFSKQHTNKLLARGGGGEAAKLRGLLAGGTDPVWKTSDSVEVKKILARFEFEQTKIQRREVGGPSRREKTSFLGVDL